MPALTQVEHALSVQLEHAKAENQRLRDRIGTLTRCLDMAVDLIPPAMRHTQAGAELTAALELGNTSAVL